MVLGMIFFSKLWLFIIVFFVFMKHWGGGCGKGPHKKAKPKRLPEDSISRKEKPLYKDEDLVPDGQSGF